MQPQPYSRKSKKPPSALRCNHKPGTNLCRKALASTTSNEHKRTPCTQGVNHSLSRGKAEGRCVGAGFMPAGERRGWSPSPAGGGLEDGASQIPSPRRGEGETAKLSGVRGESRACGVWAQALCLRGSGGDGLPLPLGEGWRMGRAKSLLPGGERGRQRSCRG